MRLARTARLAALLLPAALGALASAPPARAADDLARARAERLAAMGHCDEALRVLDEMATRAPLDARASMLAGRCQIRLERYPQAVASLERARSLDPKLPDVDLELGIARFHQNDLAGAERSFADARAAGTSSPELDFYEALVQLQQGRDTRGAAQALERAGRARPTSLEPAASYYAGLAWRASNDEAQARAALQRVIDQNPGTPWAEAAKRELEKTRPSVAAMGPWVRLEAGLEWNSNVAYLGAGLATPDEINSKSSVGGVWSADVGSELWRSDGWAIGARAFYYGSSYIEAHDFDLDYPGVGTWVDRQLSERSLLRLEAGFGNGWLGYDQYVRTYSLTPQWFYDFGEWGVTRVYSGFAYNNFRKNEGDPNGIGVPGTPCPDHEERCGPPGFGNQTHYRDRDGWGFVAGVDQNVPLRGGSTILRGGPFYEYYNSEGREWDQWGIGVHAGVRQQLPWKLVLDSEVRYAYRPFDNPSSYPNPDNVIRGIEYSLKNSDRTDNYVEVDTRLERQLTEHFSVTLRYDYLRNSSNVKVFDYDRHLVGAYVTYYWQKSPGAHP
ncbi:MAG TPA: tetratricopeptide repeat protein [Myxococcota bacterium]|nr:tetratricopeptide repeat protein [Myxococcota bacterium]